MKFTYHDTGAIRISYLNQIREFVREYGHLFPFADKKHGLGFCVLRDMDVLCAYTWGVTTNQGDYAWDQLDIVDLEYIMENVFEQAIVEWEKTAKRTQS